MSRTQSDPRADLAARVLDLVRAVAGPDSSAEVHVTSRSRALTRFARSFVHQNVVDTSERIRLRVVLDGSWAVTATDRADADSLVRAVESAVAAARLRSSRPGVPRDSRRRPRWRPAAAGTTRRRGRHRSSGRRSSGTSWPRPAGWRQPGTSRPSGPRRTYANTLGHTASGRATAAAADGIARAPGADGVARRASVRLADLSGAALGETAAAKARAGADPVDLPPGDYEVVLEPSCVADLLGFLVAYGFNGRAVAEGRSFVRPGEAQFDPAVRLRDDAVDGWSTALPYDAEGTPRRPVDLVVAGTTGAVAHDRRTAALLGAESTGHAVEGGERWGPAPPQLRLDAGAGGPATRCPGIRRGLLVSDFWYTRVLDPRTIVVTGLTRNGVWLVEDGEIVSAVTTLRFTQSYPDALAPGAVLAVGPEAVPLPERGDDSLTVAPSLHLARWHVTGGAAG